jgi:hypothetical protein
MVSRNAEAGRGRHPVPASNNFVSADKAQYKLAQPTKQANFVADWRARTQLKTGAGALQPGAAQSKIVKFGRVFQPRLEIEHRQSIPTKDWLFRVEHFGENGRHFVGKFEDVAAAFDAALSWRNQGCRIVSVDRGQP